MPTKGDLARVWLRFGAGHPAEDLDDHPEVAVGREMCKLDAAECAAEHWRIPALGLLCHRLVEAWCRHRDVVIDTLYQSPQGSELMATKTESPLLPTLFISGDPNGSVADQSVAPSVVDRTASSPSQSMTSEVPLISCGST